MASAGSGKSNTIGWLAHRLSDLHTPTDPSALDPEAVSKGLKPGVPVFDKVIVITDRRNLDAQLRETVGNFEQTAGLVVKIDEKHGAKGEQLAKALSRDTGKIVTVTLHSFPALLDYVQRNPTEIQGSRFAIIVDEAHSSQSGDAATAVRSALRDLGLDSDSDDAGATTVKAEAASLDEQLKKRAEQRSRAANLSYFAFTATPKAKTLELFGTLQNIDGKATYRPFHTYSMRQAIEEGFILDPLRNYVTYNTYWKLVNQNPDEREVDPSKANTLLARYALTHDSTVAQHAQVIVEHFVTHSRGRLGGRAKSMVVTASRQSAVQMARAIKSYIKDRDYDTKYPDLGVLVAFSGSLTVDGEETTEPKENGGLSESALPKAFAYTRADDKAARAAWFRSERVQDPGRSGEVPDRIRPAAPDDDVRQQVADRHLRRADAVAAEPDRRTQDAGGPGGTGLRQRGRGHPGVLPPVLRGGDDPPFRPQPALHRAEQGHAGGDVVRAGDGRVRGRVLRR